MISGLGSNYNILPQNTAAKNGQSATPTFAHNHTWGSINDMTNAWKAHTQDWKGYYSGAFAGSGSTGDGKISQEELNELLQSEFGGMGVKFTDGPVKEANASPGKFEVYIDDVNRQKMANDPEYRAAVMAVIQSEMAGTKGYSVQGSGGVINDRITGLSMNISEGNPLYEGVPHSAGGTGSGAVAFATSSTGGGEGAKKSMLEIIKEKLEKKLEEKKEAEKKEAAKEAREDLLEISVEAKASVKSGAVEKLDEAREDAAEKDEMTQGGELDVLA